MDVKDNINAQPDKMADHRPVGNYPTDHRRIHRVGTITCGLVLIMYGMLFLLRMALPMLNYEIIFRLWPVILVLLGIEILVCSIGSNKEEKKFVYDFPAVLIIVIMMFFAMIMAAVDYGMTVYYPIS